MPVLIERALSESVCREVLLCSRAVHEGIVYIGSEHGEFYPLDAKRGTVRDESWLDGADPPYAGHSGKVQAVVPLAGPFDLRVLTRPVAEGVRRSVAEADLLPGSMDALEQRALLASPIHYVDEETAAFLIIHGPHDTTCPFPQAKAFLEELKSRGLDADMMVLEDCGHMVHQREEIVPRMEEFFDRVLVKQGAGECQ